MKKHPCIVVVDDEQTVLRLLNRTLEPEGHGVITADNGSSVLTLLEEHRPDLVILDIMIPWLEMPIPSDRLTVFGCDEKGRPNKERAFWTIRQG